MHELCASNLLKEDMPTRYEERSLFLSGIPNIGLMSKERICEKVSGPYTIYFSIYTHFHLETQKHLGNSYRPIDVLVPIPHCLMDDQGSCPTPCKLCLFLVVLVKKTACISQK